MVKQIVMSCIVVALFGSFVDSSDAQIYRPAQAVGRVLGHGNGPGYHRCNPGPNVSYYNPWSQRNSFLISQSPQFLARFGNEFDRTPMNLLYSGTSPFDAAPRGYGAYNPANAVPMNADFVPTRKEKDNTDEVLDPPEDVEDRFEAEADAFEDVEDAETREPGSLESDTQDSPSDSEEESSVFTLKPGIFLPASHNRNGR